MTHALQASNIKGKRRIKKPTVLAHFDTTFVRLFSPLAGSPGRTMLRRSVGDVKGFHGYDVCS